MGPHGCTNAVGDGEEEAYDWDTLRKRRGEAERCEQGQVQRPATTRRHAAHLGSPTCALR